MKAARSSSQEEKAMDVKAALCFPCDSNLCIFEREGECKFPLVTGSLPVVSDAGCMAGVAWTTDAFPLLKSTSNQLVHPDIVPAVQETVPERVAFLWTCIAKALQFTPDDSPVWSVNGTHIHIRRNAGAVADFVNAIAGTDILKADKVTAWVSPILVTRRREPETKVPEEIWDELCKLARIAKLRSDSTTNPQKLPAWSDGDMFFVNSEDMADAVADVFDAMFGESVCHTGFYDPVEDERNGETCDTTGMWYVDYD